VTGVSKIIKGHESAHERHGALDPAYFELTEGT
jgi:hypothetical protein